MKINNKILIYSSNQKKISELKKIILIKKLKFVTLKNINLKSLPKEYGKTFKENAIIKSKFGFNKYKLPCVADDSGICISALQNRPGVYSNRFLNKYKTIKKAHYEILKKINKTGNNNAYFKTVISLTYKKNKTITFEGIKRGVIVQKMLGKNGFGYDPIFKPNNSKKTFAQMTKKEKNSISHRSIAINKLLKFLNKII